MSFDQFGSWDAEKQELICTCHGSFFSARGEALRGPAVSDGGPLRSYDVEFASNDVLGKVVFDDDEELEGGTEAGEEAGVEAGAEAGEEAGSKAGEEAGNTGGNDDSNVPTEYRDLMNPLGDDEATIDTGKMIYESTFCSGCHGALGEGGPASSGIVFDVDRSDASDGYFYWKLAEGVEGTAMSAYKDSLSEEQIWQVISYIRSLGK
jgi:mono/diheme cytochrome c family protein